MAPCHDPATGPGGALQQRRTADGSPSLWSEAFAEAFHCGSGALAEARGKYVGPAALERFRPGQQLTVVDVGVGLGYNSAALLEAATDRGLELHWWGLELDPRPLGLALQDPGFLGLWRPSTVAVLQQLHNQGAWTLAGSGGRWLLGDARQQLQALPPQARAGCDLVLLDAFSPSRCPQLWSQEFLEGLAALLRPDGRLLTYCTAAAVRRSLQQAGLELASLQPPGDPQAPPGGHNGEIPGAGRRRRWSHGTVASPTALAAAGSLQPLSPMEQEHLATRAAVPYRDPSLRSPSDTILAARRRAQASPDLQAGEQLGSTSAWRRRWGLDAAGTLGRTGGCR
ncbi:MAG: MnmC family methyltransferase [Synechococcaceae cyanobacterium]|nr:MnmC family methyltransferase [Synechococcaceae cyanobacterium]